MLVAPLLKVTQPFRELTFAERYCPYLAPSTKERELFPPTTPEKVADVLPLAKRIRVWAKRSEFEAAKISIKINTLTFNFFILFFSLNNKLLVLNPYVLGKINQNIN
jgi:hypothetical protein